MDFLEILNTFKGKVIDAFHFELLQNAYKLQNQNIEQLTGLNNTLKENNTLLENKSKNLTEENIKIKSLLLKLQEELDMIRLESDVKNVTDVASAILAEYQKQDVTKLYSNQILAVVSFSKLEIECAIDELIKHKFIRGSHSGIGSCYYLTPVGIKYVLEMTRSKNQYLIQIQPIEK